MSRPTHPYQRGLYGFNGLLFVPNDVDGTGGGLGGPWTQPANNTVTHPACGTTSLANQLRCTKYANGAVANVEIGPRHPAAIYQIGTAVGRGGFHCSWTFRVGAWNNNTARFFMGLASIATGSVVLLSDAGSTPTVAGAGITGTNCMGLYHDSLDGGGVASVLACAGGGGTKSAISGVSVANCSTAGASATLLTTASFASVQAGYFINGPGITAGTPGTSVLSKAGDNLSLTMSAPMTVAPGTTLTFAPAFIIAGQAYCFQMWQYPGISTTNWTLTSLGSQTPGARIFGTMGSGSGVMAPQAQMNNVADAVAGHFAVELANFWGEPLMQL